MPFGRNTGPKAPKTQPSRQITTGLSLDRKLDITGIVLALVGLLTLLSLLSVSNSTPTGNWLLFLSKAFGWGTFIFPLALVTLGLWLVLRNFERIPQLSVERMLGFVMLYADLLVGLHFFLLPAGREQAYQMAAEGQGGGYTGAFLLFLMQDNIGWGGAAVAMLAWLLIALALAFDVTVIELFRWIPPLVLRFQDWWDDRRNHFGEINPKPAPRHSFPAADLEQNRGLHPGVEPNPGSPAAISPYNDPIPS